MILLQFLFLLICVLTTASKEVNLGVRSSPVIVRKAPLFPIVSLTKQNKIKNLKPRLLLSERILCFPWYHWKKQKSNTLKQDCYCQKGSFVSHCITDKRKKIKNFKARLLLSERILCFPWYHWQKQKSKTLNQTVTVRKAPFFPIVSLTKKKNKKI